MTATSWAWLVLLLPLLGSIVIGLGFKVLPWRVAGIIGTVDLTLGSPSASRRTCQGGALDSKIRDI